jgi:hypothetical protein
MDASVRNITVTISPDISGQTATVTATHTDGTVYSVTTTTGDAFVAVGKTGTYTVQADVDGTKSSSATVTVDTSTTNYSASVNFISLTVYSDDDSEVTVAGGGV